MVQYGPPAYQAQPVYPGYQAQPMYAPHPGWPTQQIPSYLAVPEPLPEDGGIANPLFREVARGLLKSLGHTISSFFDRNTLSPRE